MLVRRRGAGKYGFGLALSRFTIAALHGFPPPPEFRDGRRDRQHRACRATPAHRPARAERPDAPARRSCRLPAPEPELARRRSYRHGGGVLPARERNTE